MSFPQDAAPGKGDAAMHYHVELKEDVTNPTSGHTHTVRNLDEALDLAGAFVRFYEALFNATRDEGEAAVYAEMTVGKDAIVPKGGEVYFELTLFHPYHPGHNAVARVTPCDGEIVQAGDAIKEILSKLMGIPAEQIIVVDKDIEDDEFPSPVVRYKGRGEGMSPN